MISSTPTLGETMRNFILVSFALSCLSLLISESRASEATAKQVIRVGFIGALSGPGKVYGTACKNGFEMGLESLRDSVSVIYEDDQFDPKRTVLAFQKLVALDHVDVLVVLGSAPAHAIATLSDKAKIPLIAWASDESVSTGRSYVLRSWPTGMEEGLRIAREARIRRMNRPAFVIAADAYSRSVLRGMEREFGRDHSALTIELEPNEWDFKTIALKVRESGADSIGICLNIGQTAVFARELRSLLVQHPLFGCISLDNPEEWRQARGTLTGAWFVTGNVAPSFRSEYQRRYGNESAITGAAVHHDVAKVIGEAARNGFVRGRPIENFVTSKARVGAVGEYNLAVEGDDRFLSVPLVVKEVPPL